MNQNQLGDNIARYRKEKGLSQEKVSEYMEVSRQAVTKWESNLSKPSAENLIKLAELFGIGVENLLNGNKGLKVSDKKEIVPNKFSWIFCGVSIVCLIAYIIIGNLHNTFSVGTLICMFVIVIPIQFFLHIYFSNAINNDSFSGIAGYDEKIEYNYYEIKKLLMHIDLHLETMSTLYVFLLCVINCVDLQIGWINGVLLGLYIMNVTGSILINNYRAIDKIYINQVDKERAKHSLPITLAYIFLLLIGTGIMVAIFEMKGIENNTAPAMKLCGIFFLGILTATIGYFLESKNIKKWCLDNTQYKVSKASIGSLLICLILFGLICIV